MIRLLLFFWVSKLSWMLVSASYQDCIDAIDTGCRQGVTDLNKYCLDDGRIINGSCNFHKEFCLQTYFHNETIELQSHGTHCQYHEHSNWYNPNITTGSVNLFSNMIHGIDDRLKAVEIAGHTPKEAIKIFSKQDHTHKVYTRNTNCWAYGLDLSCISPWNSYGNNRKAGTLLSPRHAVWARHYSIKINSTLRFVDQNNNVFDRKIIKTRAIPVRTNSTNHRAYLSGFDMVIGLLDSDVPSTISFAKVLPKYFKEFHPTRMYVRLPTLCTDFEEKALVDDFSIQAHNMARLTVPFRNTTRYQYYEPKISGDSGNPCFFVVENELVFLFVFTFGGAGSGTSIQYHHDDVNQIMHSLGGGYQLTEVDLSKYLGNHDINSLFG
ncbi:uncharacterized protein LOC143068018 [Mytilus galloprovincialis]|uniref:uncharacterized protein LOC143068018 n=1 Tax=Mytilus galloprovincialis TaxID=29158 RepID=UPI003F7CB2E6